MFFIVSESCLKFFLATLPPALANSVTKEFVSAMSALDKAIKGSDKLDKVAKGK